MGLCLIGNHACMVSRRPGFESHQGVFPTCPFGWWRFPPGTNPKFHQDVNIIALINPKKNSKTELSAWHFNKQLEFIVTLDPLQDQQRKIESFVIERKTLEKIIQSTHDRRSFYVKQLHNLQGHESTLKAERDFAWNQYKKTDSMFQELRKETKSEVEAANSKVQNLIHDLEELQLSNMEKNRTISGLQDDIAVLESDSRKKSEEISRLTKELESLKGKSNRSVTPVLCRCMKSSSEKEAASTSILSTRWRPLWRGSFKLNFHGNQSFSFPVNINTECNKYINQVNNVIQSHNHPMIEDFRIRFCLDIRHKSLIDQWLQFSVNKKVEFLELNLSPMFPSLGGGSYDFPSRLFEMELASLKKLILKNVNVNATILVNLLSNSPNLETLSICYPQYLRHIRAGGRALKLKHFEILDRKSYSIRSIYLSDFDLESFTYVFDILSTCASSLRSLSVALYRGEGPVNSKDYYELPNVKQLRVMFCGNKHDCLLDLAYMVNAFPRMESFKLEIDWTAPVVVRRKARDYTNRLEHLKYVAIVGYKGRICDYELAAYIINIAHALKKNCDCNFKRLYHEARCSIFCYAPRINTTSRCGIGHTLSNPTTFK
ncbi:uncharacterized protein [Rutidosis leptorrhynchoides]|uniref:uncharacterized protein n=1 Tax=Rutidosis leptorrhynchoides TaxID=125765 RepID=UPI003A996F38